MKYTNATVVDISVKQRGQFLALAIPDDGVEGAVPNGPGLADLADRIDASPEPCSCSARQAAEPRFSSASQPEQPPSWQRAVVDGHKNKDLPDDPAILDRASADSLAGPSDQQIPFRWSSCRVPVAGAGAAHGRPVA